MSMKLSYRICLMGAHVVFAVSAVEDPERKPAVATGFRGVVISQWRQVRGAVSIAVRAPLSTKMTTGHPCGEGRWVSGQPGASKIA